MTDQSVGKGLYGFGSPLQVAALALFSCWLMLLGEPVTAQPASGPAADFVPNDPNTCLLCHGSDGPVPAEVVMQSVHGSTANPGSPFAQGQLGCQSCHGPSAEHLGMASDGSRRQPAMVFDSRRPPAQQNAVCQSCHEQDIAHEWPGSAHEFAEITCAGCHTVHAPEDPSLGFEGQTSLCLTCHQRQQAEMLMASSHPLRAGQMACADCHAPHGGSGQSLLIEQSVNDQCYQCHAEKRGPFLWEHAPVVEDCTNCHMPHGSNHSNLLQARMPWMCQQCHMAAFHPSNLESGLGVPPLGGSSNMLGQSCLSCHSQVHGSNHPSGSGLTR